MTTIDLGEISIPVPMLHFRNNRHRVCEILREESRRDGIVDKYTYILLKGSRNIADDNERNYPPCMYRQEENFEYLFGIKEPNCYGAIHVFSEHTALFIPNNLKKSVEIMSKAYEVDYVQFVDSMERFFGTSDVSNILTITDPLGDGYKNNAFFQGVDKYQFDCNYLSPILLECRLIKTPTEVKILKCLSKMACDIHCKMMQVVEPGVQINQMENIILQNAFESQSKSTQIYSFLRGSMLNAMYPNVKAKNSCFEKEELCFFDLGATNGGYIVDLKSCFPANGQFTANQMFIYNCVYEVRKCILQTICEGVDWDDIRKLSHEVILEKLRDGGLLKGTISDMIQTNLGYVFQPNGIGSIVGLNTRKCISPIDGRPDGTDNNSTIGSNIVKLNRILKSGMQVSIEPSCYFINILIEKAYADSTLNIFMNKPIIDEFHGFSGMCFSDNIIITASGYESLTTRPVSAVKIESYMNANRDEQ